MTDTRPDGSELRVRAWLTQRGLGLTPEESKTLPPAPAHLPPGFETRPRDWLDEILDSNTDAPSPRPTPAPAAAPAAPAAEPRERRDWGWLWQWIRPWHTLTAGFTSVLPVFNGWSLSTGWARILHDMRADTIGGAYTTAGIALAATYLLDLKRHRWLLRLALITTAIGALGVFDWFDPITFVTGVHR